MFIATFFKLFWNHKTRKCYIRTAAIGWWFIITVWIRILICDNTVWLKILIIYILYLLWSLHLYLQSKKVESSNFCSTKDAIVETNLPSCSLSQLNIENELLTLGVLAKTATNENIKITKICKLGLLFISRTFETFNVGVF